MRLSELIIDYMPRVQGISQRMQGITMERIISLFAIASLDNERYLCLNSRYLAGDSALVNCDLLNISGLLSSEETGHRVLVIPSAPPSTTIYNCLSNTPTQNTLEGLSALQPRPPPAQSSSVSYSPPRELPWKCITAMMQGKILSRVSL